VLFFLICVDVTDLCKVVLCYTNSNILICIIVIYKFVFKYLYAMGSKPKKQAIIKNDSIVRKHCINKKDSEDARC
jgi:hypothetical protein